MSQHGGKREGSGRTPLPEGEKKIAKTIYITPTLQSDIDEYAVGNSFSEKCIDLISAQIDRRKRAKDRTVKFIDLFAGLGGIRLGFENAFRGKGFDPVCVFSSEIKDYAIRAYNIVAGKLSFEFTKILDPADLAPTLVAMDVSHLGVVDGNGLRRLSIREGQRLFGFPEDYDLSFLKESDAFDLLGNTVCIPVIKAISERLADMYAN